VPTTIQPQTGSFSDTDSKESPWPAFSTDQGFTSAIGMTGFEPAPLDLVRRTNDLALTHGNNDRPARTLSFVNIACRSLSLHVA
jgi:hypothetical protein